MKLLELLRPFGAIIYIICITLSFCGFFPAIPIEIRLGISIIVVFVFIRTKSKLNILFFGYLIYLLLTILIASPNPIFRSYERLAVFAILFAVVSPLFIGDYAKRFRIKALTSLLVLCTILSVLSFFAFFIGINLFVRNDIILDDYMSNAGWFSGLFSHSMILGQLSALSACYVLYLFLKFKKYIFLLILIPTMGSVLFAASRTAFIAMAVAFIFEIYRFSNKKLVFVKYIVICTFFISLSFPLWQKGFSRMESKGSVVSNKGFSSRDYAWNERINEFKSSPITGLGYAAATDKYAHGNGRIEYGSSWLMFLSTTGLIGFTFIIILFFLSYKATICSHDDEAFLLSTLLVFSAIHMIAEGYALAGSNPQSSVLWLIIGCCYDLRYEKQIK